MPSTATKGSPPAQAPTTPTAAHLETIRSAIPSDRAISDILGVSPSQISRWRRGQEPDLDNADRLAALALAVEMLSRWLHPEVVEGWLTGPNACLGGRSPTYLLRRGQLAEVIGAVEALKAGVFA